MISAPAPMTWRPRCIEWDGTNPPGGRSRPIEMAYRHSLSRALLGLLMRDVALTRGEVNGPMGCWPQIEALSAYHLGRSA